ncbi:MAG: transposase family protein, partial [Aeromonadales bacterium]|nr:transposase family protein [Aeromonadales bacterium]
MAERSLSRLRAPGRPCCSDTEDRYRECLARAGITDKWQIEKHLMKVRRSREDYELFASTHPEVSRLLDLAWEFAAALAPYDTRDPDRIIYSAETVLMVTLPATCCGCSDCRQIAAFWHNQTPMLQCLFEMPLPGCDISDEEVRIILKMVPPDAFEAFFRQRFSDFRKGDPELSGDT